jgi:hypothetical protein
MTDTEAESIARFCFRNRVKIAETTRCGCFYCQAVFLGSEVREWVDDERTALCPRCGIDAVLADVTNAETLRELHRYRFEASVPVGRAAERFATADGNRSR